MHERVCIEVPLERPLGAKTRIAHKVRPQRARRKRVRRVAGIEYGEYRARLKVPLQTKLPAAGHKSCPPVFCKCGKLIQAADRQMMRQVGSAESLVEMSIVLIHVAARIAELVARGDVIQELRKRIVCEERIPV